MDDFKEIILNFPKQFKTGLKAAGNVKISGKFKAVLVCAMGGSALPAEILNIYFQEQKIKTPVIIHKDYGLPYRVDDDHLIVCVSYSGNTEETLSAYQEAAKKRLPCIALTSGGELAKLCDKDKTPWVQVPPGLPPRMAVGYQFAALLKIMINTRLLLKEAELELLALEKKLALSELETEAKTLTRRLKDKIILIYSASRLKPLAYIWKIKFNENAKIHAFCNYFPELNHNEMSAFEKPQENIHVLILKDTADHQKIIKRMEITAKIIKARGVNVDFIDLKKGDILFKIFDNLLLSDWVSYYLALKSDTNPLKLDLVEEFKKKL